MCLPGEKLIGSTGRGEFDFPGESRSSHAQGGSAEKDSEKFSCHGFRSLVKRKLNVSIIIQPTTTMSRSAVKRNRDSICVWCFSDDGGGMRENQDQEVGRSWARG